MNKEINKETLKLAIEIMFDIIKIKHMQFPLARIMAKNNKPKES